MKNILSFTFLIFMSVWMTGCTDNFEKYNTYPYTPNLSAASDLERMVEAMMYVQQNNSQMIDQMVGALGGYFTCSNRWGGRNFDTFNPPADWNAIPYDETFIHVYPGYFRMMEKSQGTGHFAAMARLVRAASMIRVTDTYGPIPYSKVGKGKMYVPYDTHEEVYKNIIEDLQFAATVLLNFAESFPSMKPIEKEDAIYSGDYNLWARLANSLTLRVAIRTGDQEAAKAAIAHPAGMIEQNSHNALRNPKVQGNPYQLAAASWGDLRISSSITDYMNGYSDPRMGAYFLKSTFSGQTDRYIGMRSGEAVFDGSAVAGYSQPKYSSGDYLPVFVAAETQFLLAEAALRGWISGNAKEYYEKGIRLSMEQYGVNSALADSYVSDNLSVPQNHANDPRGALYNYNRSSKITIAWNDSGLFEQKLERIITQKWIANYPLGLEAWAEYRRTGYPELAPVMDNLSNEGVDSKRGMRRLSYPIKEKDYNTTNCNAAIVMLGGKDTPAVDLFWAKKN